MPSSPPPWPKDHRGAQMTFRSIHLPASDIPLDTVVEQQEEDYESERSMNGEEDALDYSLGGEEASVNADSNAADGQIQPREKVRWIVQMSSSSGQPSSSNGGFPGRGKQAGEDNRAERNTVARSSSKDSPSSTGKQTSSSTTGGFSPVFISKHNTVDGRVDYTAVDVSNPQNAECTQAEGDDSRDEGDVSNISDSRQDNHPGLPAISSFVNVDRGGYSDQDSFKHRPLSPSASSSILPSDSISQAGNFHHLRRPDRKSAANDDDLPTVDEERPDSQKMTAREPGFDAQPNPEPNTREEHSGLDPGPVSSQFLDVPQGNTVVAKTGNAAMTREDAPRHGSGTVGSVETVVHWSDKDQHEQTQGITVHATNPTNLGGRPITPDQSMVPKDREEPQKRANSTSTKGPTPKRIRTLNKLELPDKSEHVSDAVQEQHKRMQAVTGKRKDARYDNTTASCDPDTLSKREILRPRNPTPAQQRALLDPGAIYGIAMSSGFDMVKEQLEQLSFPERGEEESEMRSVVYKAATVHMNAMRTSHDLSRKPSVSTQDYVDEATKIMEYIRAQRQARAELPNVLESDAEHQDFESSDIEDSPQSVSRPPSRDGPNSAWRSRDERSLDPRVVSHLQRYQETGDESFLVDSVLESMHLRDDNAEEEDYADTAAAKDPELDNEEPEIRIFGPLPEQKDDSPGQSPVKTHSSHQSTDSNQTMNSQRSRAVANIHPDKIPHLLDVEKSGMRFDNERNTWIRAKRPKSFANISSSAGTEDDPFMNIPDLSTNEMEELQRELHREEHEPEREGGDHVQLRKEGMTHSDEADLDQDGLAEAPADEDSAIVPSSQLNMPGLGNDHREADQVLGGDDGPICGSRRSERPLAKVPTGTVRSRRRSTSAMSSSPPRPLQGSISDDEEDSVDGRDDLILHPENRPDSHEVVEDYGAEDSIVAVNNPHKKTPLERFRQHQQQEIFITRTRPDGRAMSLTLSVSTPLPSRRHDTRLAVPSSGMKSNIWQSMSPLSDFTMHQDDSRHLMARHIAQGNERRMVTARSRVQAPAAAGDLVHKITDAQPDEPYWELMEDLALVGKELDNLHMLNDFCPRLEQLDVTNNDLKHLDGAPRAVRELKVLNNNLTSLTTWAHLSNLQYLDVSSNELESLEGLRGLVHLREVRADNNNISDIEGVFDLDGLLSISLRHNSLRSVDFTSAGLRRLQSLDLSSNSLHVLNGLHYLPSLEHLDVNSNLLSAFPDEPKSQSQCWRLESLLLANNNLSTIDVSLFPNLETLDLDSNKVTSVSGVTTVSSLQCLSLRSQTPPPDAKQPLSDSLRTFSDIHHLYLSGNNLTTLPLSINAQNPLLNTRTLELALCGLQSLPADFSATFPNLRTLNLNFNALKDLRPLRGLRRLSSLHLAGNRVSRLRRTLSVLSTLSEILQTLDMRDNPLLQGFYPPPTSTSNTISTGLARNTTTSSTLVNYPTTTSSLEKTPQSHLQHLLPLSTTSAAEEEKYLTHLDEDTRLRRRVYEILLAAKCKGLRSVDGREWKRERVLGMRGGEDGDEDCHGDWKRLVGLGVVEIIGRCEEGKERGL